MKLPIYFSFLLLILTGTALNGYGQEPKRQQQGDSIIRQRQKAEQNYYQKNLGIDSAKAVLVARIQEGYKAALKLIVADTGLNEAAKRARINAIMENKNQKLRGVLNPAQQERIIPTTERMPSKSAKQP